MGGLLVVAPLTAHFAIEPEVLSTTKGANFSDSQAGGSFSMRYVELPVLLRYDAAGSNKIHPFFFGGPAVSLEASCELKGSDGTASVSIGCDEVEAQGLK